MMPHTPVLFVHLLAAATLFGAMAIAHLALHRLRAAGTSQEARLWLGVLGRVKLVMPVAGVVLLVAGAELARVDGALSSGWVITAAVGVVVALVLGATVNAAWARRVGAALVWLPDGPLPGPALEAIARPSIMVSSRVSVGLVLGILFLMAARPGAVISALIVPAGALLGALSAWPLTRRAAVKQGPATLATEHRPD
jgi:hypothetical protein